MFAFSIKDLQKLNKDIVLLKENNDGNPFFTVNYEKGKIFAKMKSMQGFVLLQIKIQKKQILALIKKNLKEIIGTNQCVVCYFTTKSIVVKKCQI